MCKHTQHFNNPREEGPAGALQGEACGHRGDLLPGAQSTKGWAGLVPTSTKSQLQSQTPESLPVRLQS